MKTLITSALSLMVIWNVSAQQAADTTHISLKGRNYILISLPDTICSIDEGEECSNITEAHWAGVEFGPTFLLNSQMETSFPSNPQWENDPGKSFSWNFNVLEHKFPIYKNYIGVTTGLGFNVTGVGLKQYVLKDTPAGLVATVDTTGTGPAFYKNKLRAVYLTVPLLLELCSNRTRRDEGFYLAAGLVGGIRIASSVKTKINAQGSDRKEKIKGDYALNTLLVNATLRLGYEGWGLFANYSILPFFDTHKTVEVHPLTLGLSFNF